MPPDILFLITESSYFLSHRRPLADACRRIGWKTTLITNPAKDDRDCLADINVVPLDMRRDSHHIIPEMLILLRTIILLRRERPRLLHAVGLKPVLYGAFATHLMASKAVCALAGLGYLFTSARPMIRLLRRLIIFLLRAAFHSKRIHLILQNDDDANALLSAGVAKPEQITMIYGSGVDLVKFHPTPEPEGVAVFAVVARMLADKGIREMILAARILRHRGVQCRIQLVGDVDERNLSSLSRRDLSAWAKEGIVEWLGHCENVAAIWRDAHVCVLPSYREGMPKALLEAAACGRPIITTDVPGCKAVVDDGIEGILVPPNDWHALADAMEKLAMSPDMRRRMGQAARKRAEERFGVDGVVEQTMDLYRKMLDRS